MTRKKVKLAYISNDSARKATFKKRKRGLMKKVSELSTLCGIEACAIIYSPYDSQPEVWPSAMGVQRVLAQFKKMPEMEQSKKMVNQETFLRQRIAKASEQLKKQRKDNREKEMTRVMFQSLTGNGVQCLNMMDLNDLGWLIDQNLKDIAKRMEQSAERSKAHQPEVVQFMQAEDGFNFNQLLQDQKQAAGFELNVDGMQRQPWFMDFVADDLLLPFGDAHNHNNSMWSNAFFP